MYRVVVVLVGNGDEDYFSRMRINRGGSCRGLKSLLLTYNNNSNNSGGGVYSAAAERLGFGCLVGDGRGRIDCTSTRGALIES